MTSQNTIVMTNELLTDKVNLINTLEKLYCGEKKTYRIELEWSQVAQLELIFDTIIREHGVLDVEFHYDISA